MIAVVAAGHRAQLFRTAHGLYALAVIAHDALVEGRTSIEDAAAGLASIDWTWGNRDFCQHIGQIRKGGHWGLNTGGNTTSYLIDYCRPRCKVYLSQAA